jgi:DNA replication protein DnaC
LIMAGYESSGMGNLINNCSFENFDLSHFKSNDSLYENMKTVYSICKRYTREFTTDSALVCGGSPNLIMTGATGLGKTHLSAAIAKGLIDRGYDVVYDTALDIFSNFESERFGTERYSENKKSGLYFDCDVLIIDDLGTELTNQFTTMILFNLINTRLNRKKAMIINTNLSLKELRGRYADRITSRILGEFRPLQFCGTDYRSIKLRS